ncbi:MAG: DUF2007 domain-containing protein [Bacteroidia bacterium]
MDNPSLKEVARIPDSIQAEMLRSLLANEGIESVLFENMITQIAPHHTGGQGGVRLMVNPADHTVAKEIVEQALGIEEPVYDEAASRNDRNLKLAFGLVLGAVVLVALGALLFGSVV